MQPLLVQLWNTMIVASLGALIGALAIQFSTRIVASFKPSYLMAFRAALLGSIVTSLICMAINASMEPPPAGQLDWIKIVLLALTGLTVYTAVIAPLIKHPEKGSIGFKKAILVSVIQNIVMLFVMSLFAVIYLFTMKTR